MRNVIAETFIKSFYQNGHNLFAIVWEDTDCFRVQLDHFSKKYKRKETALKMYKEYLEKAKAHRMTKEKKMTNPLTRADELRNDIENLHFTIRYYIGVLAELEQLGRTHTEDFKRTEANVNVLKRNLRTLEAQLESEEEAWI